LVKKKRKEKKVEKLGARIARSEPFFFSAALISKIGLFFNFLFSPFGNANATRDVNNKQRQQHDDGSQQFLPFYFLFQIIINHLSPFFRWRSLPQSTIWLHADH